MKYELNNDFIVGLINVKTPMDFSEFILYILFFVFCEIHNSLVFNT